MNIKSKQLFTNVKPISWYGNVVQFSLVRMAIACLFVFLMYWLQSLITSNLTGKISEPYFTYLSYFNSVVGFLLLVLGYNLYARFIERRKAYELAFEKSPGDFIIGFLIGMCLVLIMILILFGLGYYRIVDFNAKNIIIKGLFFFGIGAFIQELIFRVIIFKITEEYLGSWLSLIIIALVFGIAHIKNDNGTIWTSLALSVADLLLTAAYIYTRRIWLVFGIHFSWNYFQDGIFGMPNSGITSLPSWINPSVSGPEWVTGGAFGIEASVITLLLSLAVGIVILKKAYSLDLIVTPFWKRT